MKRIHRSFVSHLVGYIVFLVLMVALSVTTLIWLDENFQFALILVIMIIVIFISWWFKQVMYQLVNTSYLYKIRDDEGTPLILHSTIEFEDVMSNALKQKYTKLVDEKDYTILYLAQRDHIRKIFNHYILYVVVIIKSHSLPFYLKETDDVINQLQVNLQQQKMRIDRLIITQYKWFEDMTDEIRLDLADIMFIKTDKHVVSTKNVGIFNKHAIASVLYAKTYRPSLYYDLHLKAIQSMIKRSS
jgi:hypothetical protein